MALFKPFKGSRATLDAQPLHDGYAYFCTDDGSFHIDYVDNNGNLQRKQINAKDAETLMGMSLDEIKVRPDFAQTDSAQPDYIKNKPEIVNEPVENSEALITSGGVYEALQNVSGGSGGTGVSYKAGNLIEIKNNTINSTLGNLISSSEEIKDEILNINCIIFDEQIEEQDYILYDERRDYKIPSVGDKVNIEITPINAATPILFEDITPVRANLEGMDITVIAVNTDQSFYTILNGELLIKNDESLPACMIVLLSGPTKICMLQTTDDYTGGSIKVISTAKKDTYVTLPDNALKAGNNIKIENGVISSTLGGTITDDYTTILEPSSLMKIPDDENPFVGFNAYMIEGGESSDWISVNEPIELYMIDSSGNETNLGTVIPKMDSALDSISEMMGIPFCAVNVNASNSIADVLTNATLTPADTSIPYTFMFFVVPMPGNIMAGCLTNQTYDGYSIKIRRKNRVSKLMIEGSETGGSQIQPPFYSWVKATDSIYAGQLLHIYAYDLSNDTLPPISYYVGSCRLDDSIFYNTVTNTTAKEQIIGTVNISNSLEEIFTTGNVVAEDSYIPYSFSAVYVYSSGNFVLSSAANIPNLMVEVKIDEPITYVNKIPADMLPDDMTVNVGNLMTIEDGVIHSILGMPGKGLTPISNVTLSSYIMSYGAYIWSDLCTVTEPLSLKDNIAVDVYIPGEDKAVHLEGQLFEDSDEDDIYYGVNTTITTFSQFINNFSIPAKDSSLPTFIVYINNGKLNIYTKNNYTDYNLSLYKSGFGKLPNEALNFDETPTENSENLVKSGDIYTAIQNAKPNLEYDTEPTSGSENLVNSDGIYKAIQKALIDVWGEIY